MAICDVGCRLMLAPAALDCWNLASRAIYVSASLLPPPSPTDLHHVETQNDPCRNAGPPRHALEARRRQLAPQASQHDAVLTARTGSWQGAAAAQSDETMRGRYRWGGGDGGAEAARKTPPPTQLPGGQVAGWGGSQWGEAGGVGAVDLGVGGGGGLLPYTVLLADSVHWSALAGQAAAAAAGLQPPATIRRFAS